MRPVDLTWCRLAARAARAEEGESVERERVAWTERVPGFGLAARLAVLDALLRWAHRLDDGLAAAADSVALADWIYERAIDDVRAYVP